MAERMLVVTADDFGMGPEVTRGILDLARAKLVTASVLLVNSPFAEAAVSVWKKQLPDFEVGWHPTLTLDRPVMKASRVSTLVDATGRFNGLGSLLSRLLTGRVCRDQLRAELSAQLDRYIDLVGSPPTLVNGHHHIHVFPHVREVLGEIVRQRAPGAYIRRVREFPPALWRIADSRLKRRFLSALGTSNGCRLAWSGFPTNDFLLGLANPAHATTADFFVRWFDVMPAGVLELGCHPGYSDEAIFGRDAKPGDFATIDQRPAELQRLLSPEFRDALSACAARLVSPRELTQQQRSALRYAA